jgi:hypothetical protein
MLKVSISERILNDLTLEKLNKSIKKKKIDFLGEGYSRSVYDLKNLCLNGLVFKMSKASSEIGYAQTVEEYEIFLKSKDNPLHLKYIAKIVKSFGKYGHVMEKASEVGNIHELHRKLNIHCNNIELDHVLEKFGVYKNDIYDVDKNAGLFGNEVKIIDYGFTNNTYNRNIA